MTDCTTTLVLSNIKISKNTVVFEVLQDSFLSSILYLFYMIELLETCNNNNERLSTSTFVNDIILLIYKLFTKHNYHILLQTHNQCLDQTHKYKIIFVFEKYELIHLAHQLKRFNMQAQLQLEEIVKQSNILVHILKIWLNLKL